MTRMSNNRVDLLRRVGLFSACSRRELNGVASLATPVEATEGEVLAREGKLGSELFVIASGQCASDTSGQGSGDALPRRCVWRDGAAGWGAEGRNSDRGNPDEPLRSWPARILDPARIRTGPRSQDPVVVGPASTRRSETGPSLGS